MKFSHLCAISFGALMLFGCTNSKYSSPVLIERGVGQNEYEREYFISKESMGIDKHLQNTFKQGYIEEGMTTDMATFCGDLPITKPLTAWSGNISPAKASSSRVSSGSTRNRLV